MNIRRSKLLLVTAMLAVTASAPVYLCVPAAQAAEPTAATTCVAEAGALVHHFSEYKQSAERRRSQIRNHPPAEIRRMQYLCGELAKSPPQNSDQLIQRCRDSVNALRVRYPDAGDHTEKLWGYCQGSS